MFELYNMRTIYSRKKKKKEREREEGGLGGLDDLAEGNGAGGESKDRETCN